MNWSDKTIQTYDKSAKALAQYFKGIGPRLADIKRGLELAEMKSNARVVEIGCGDGRDALEITKRVAWYQGFDPSKGLLKIAQATAPEASFVLADALTYHYPQNLDVVYAFASLLHVNKNDLRLICQQVAKALRPKGIFYISLKERDTYSFEVKKDSHGERMFYYYNLKLVQDIAGTNFVKVYGSTQTIGSTRWFTVALKKL